MGPISSVVMMLNNEHTLVTEMKFNKIQGYDTNKEFQHRCQTEQSTID
jgi:hypothetical protein